MILLTLLINFFRCFFVFFFRNNKKGNLFGVIFNCWNCVFRFVSFVVVGVVFIVGRYLGLVFVTLLYFTPDQRTMDEYTEKIEIQMGKTLTQNKQTNGQTIKGKAPSQIQNKVELFFC